MNQCHKCGAQLSASQSICHQCNTKVRFMSNDKDRKKSSKLQKLQTFEDTATSKYAKSMPHQSHVPTPFKLDKSKRNIFNQPLSDHHTNPLFESSSTSAYSSHSHSPSGHESSQVADESDHVASSDVTFSPITSPLHSPSASQSNAHTTREEPENYDSTPARFSTAHPSHQRHVPRSKPPHIMAEKTLPRLGLGSSADLTYPHATPAHATPMISQSYSNDQYYDSHASIDDFDEDFTEVHHLGAEDSIDDMTQAKTMDHTIDSDLDDFDLLEFDDSMNHTSIEDIPSSIEPHVQLQQITGLKSTAQSTFDPNQTYEFLPSYYLLELQAPHQMIPLSDQLILGKRHPALAHTQSAPVQFTCVSENQQWYFQASKQTTWMHIDKPYTLNIHDSIRIGQSILTLIPTQEYMSHTPLFDNLSLHPLSMVWQSTTGDWRGCFAIDRDVIRIGRGQGDWILKDPYIDYVHVALQQKDQQIVVYPLQSSNGVWRPMLTKETIQNGSLIEIGQRLFQVLQK